jgi:hypothetical protein
VGIGNAVASVSIGPKTIQKLRFRNLPFAFLLFVIAQQFLTGFAAAAGIALVNSVGNLGEFVGSHMIGAIGTKTGSLYRGLAIAGVSLFLSATLVLLLPRKARLPGMN